MLYLPYPFKRCPKCREERFATAAYFSRSNRTKDGLKCHCKTCTRNYRLKRQSEDSYQEHAKAYRRANSAREYERMKAWIAEHPEQHRKNQRRYDSKHKAEQKVRKSQRRAREVAAEGTHTPADVRRQYKWQDGCCFYCGKSVGNTYHVDHYIPLHPDGTNWPENIVIACPACNMSKHDTQPTEWLNRHPELRLTFLEQNALCLRRKVDHLRSHR